MERSLWALQCLERSSDLNPLHHFLEDMISENTRRSLEGVISEIGNTAIKISTGIHFFFIFMSHISRPVAGINCVIRIK